MKLPARNTHTGTIMYWISDADALRILAEGPTKLQRHEAARIAAAAEIKDIQRPDIVGDAPTLRRGRPLCPVSGPPWPIWTRHDNDIISNLTTPTARRSGGDIRAASSYSRPARAARSGGRSVLLHARGAYRVFASPPRCPHHRGRLLVDTTGPLARWHGDTGWGWIRARGRGRPRLRLRCTGWRTKKRRHW